MNYVCAAFLAMAVSLCATELRVYSEFARIDASGEVTAPANPREILSPAIARNAFTSFQVVVQAAKGAHYTLYVSQNPPDAVRVTLYREAGDRLEQVALPYQGEGTQVLWMDLWAERGAPVRRIKVEPQLEINNDWMVYPMEVRVMDATAPDGPWLEGSATPPEVMQSFLCGTQLEPAPAGAPSIARLRFRNAQQDLALASRISKEGLRAMFGITCDAAPPGEAEWYLRIRDYLYRLR